MADLIRPVVWSTLSTTAARQPRSEATRAAIRRASRPGSGRGSLVRPDHPGEQPGQQREQADDLDPGDDPPISAADAVVGDAGLAEDVEPFGAPSGPSWAGTPGRLDWAQISQGKAGCIARGSSSSGTDRRDRDREDVGMDEKRTAPTPGTSPDVWRAGRRTAGMMTGRRRSTRSADPDRPRPGRSRVDLNRPSESARDDSIRAGPGRDRAGSGLAGVPANSSGTAARPACRGRHRPACRPPGGGPGAGRSRGRSGGRALRGSSSGGRRPGAAPRAA